MTEAIAPLEITVTVRSSVDEAFRLFTSGISSWWPKATHSVGQEKTNAIVMDDYVGGELYELTTDGEKHVWGTILAFEPPHRVAFTWHPGRGVETQQEVEMRFRYVGDVTEVALSHRGWEALGAEALETRIGYSQGWNVILGQIYKQAAENRQEVSQ
jgi:uncharacterized protein YndB with AHSA1/START domain